MKSAVFSFLAKMLLASPFTYVGFIVAIVVPSVLKWKPNTRLWLLALLLNLPSLQVLYLASSDYGSCRCWFDTLGFDPALWPANLLGDGLTHEIAEA